MGIAENMWQAFLKEHPDAASGKYTMDEINRKLAAFNQKLNQQPVADFESLSPEQMHFLLHNPLGANSVVQLKEKYPDEVLNAIPFLKLIEMLVEELQTKKKIKLTPKGNLNMDLCKRLYETKLLNQDDIDSGITIKISEDNIAFIQALKACLQISGLVKKRNNILTLTKAGETTLKKGRTALFKQIFTVYTGRFNWAYLDYAENTNAGHFAWAYSLFLLHRFGKEWQESAFYAKKVLQAFPMFPEKIPHTVYNYQLEFASVYRWRFMEKFAPYFGLIERRREREPGVYPDKLLVRKAELFDAIFDVRI